MDDQPSSLSSPLVDCGDERPPCELHWPLCNQIKVAGTKANDVRISMDI